MAEPITIHINGEERTVSAAPDASLLELLREDLGLTGTKQGCGEGLCGACTVLLDGRPARACITPARSAAGRRVVTIEGLAAGDRLDPLQEAFVAHGALQCGFCTPGMILEARALLDAPGQRKLAPADVDEALGTHICRCGGYQRIRAAVLAAAGGGKGGA